MKLGEWVKQYRASHGLSMQAMADLSGFSKAYIGMLEKGINPTTQKPLSPTMQTFQKIADATNTDVDTLIKALDSDQPITVNAEEGYYTDPETAEIANALKEGDGMLRVLFDAARDLPPEKMKEAASYIEYLKTKQHPEEE